MKKADTFPTISTHAARTLAAFLPANLVAPERRQQFRHVALRRQLLCSGMAVALLIGSVFRHAALATEAPNDAMPTSDPFAAFVSEASKLFGIPASWIRAVMRVESAGDVRSMSPKGAMGLMQIMPETWVALRTHYGLGADPYDAHDNIFAGAAYLRELHDRYGEPGFLAAYNAGPARYEQHLATGQPLPVETQNYVASLAPIVGGEHIDSSVVAHSITQPWTEAALFVERSDSSRATIAVTPATHERQHKTRTSIADWTALAPQSAGLFVATNHRTVGP